MSIRTSNLSFWNIRVDLEKSHGSYVYDKETDREYLDFFSMYSSLPLGYNHKIFDEKFHDEMRKISTVKVTNCEFHSDVYDEFCESFYDFAGVNGKYNCYHFTCTGSLAVECAVKMAMDYTGKKRIVCIDNSFHGVHSYGNFATSKFYPVGDRLDGYPDLSWPKINTVEEFMEELERGDIAGILIEPIQSTFGDNHLSNLFIRQISSLAKRNDIPVIFDEVQTGFGVTGKPWFFQWINVWPDIVVFGKKSQVSGVMTRDTYFENNKKLSVTFDGDIVDMLRAKYVMKAYNKYNLLQEAREKGLELLKKLKDIEGILNVRGKGLLVAFDLENRETRDKFSVDLKANGMICNPTWRKIYSFETKFGRYG